MNKAQVQQLIEQYIKESKLDEKTSELRAQIQDLKAQIGVDRLDLLEERVEHLAKRGLPYEQALDLAIAECEQRDLERKIKEDERARARTQVELEEAERQAALELEDEANNAD